MINFWKAVEEYDNQNRKLTDPDTCQSCGNTDFEMTDYCRICTSCFAQEDIPTPFLDLADETRANLYCKRIPKNPRKPKPEPPSLERVEIPYIRVTPPSPERPQLKWKDVRKKASKDSMIKKYSFKKSEEYSLSTQRCKTLFNVILLVLGSKKISSTDIMLSETNEITYISGISFIPGDFIMVKSIF